MLWLIQTMLLKVTSAVQLKKCMAYGYLTVVLPAIKAMFENYC